MLLNVIRELRASAKFNKTFLEKILFLLSKEYGFSEKVKFYSFFPYQYGPFSNLSYYDLGKLQGERCLENEELTETGISEASKLDDELISGIKDCIGRFPDSDSVLEYVYAKYPEYAIKSKLKTGEEGEPSPGFFTIGYEGRDIDAFLNSLIQNRIQALVDVRYNPFSMNFSFIQGKLRSYLEKNGIEYVHVKGLGIEGESRKNLETDGDYTKLFEYYESSILPVHSSDFATVLELGQKKRIALMCFERDAWHCHRGVLGKKLRENGFEVVDL